VQHCIYGLKDPYALFLELRTCKSSFLTGHFPLAKYAPLFAGTEIVTFLRDPVAQVVSHFNHFKNKHGYEAPFEDFIEEERFINMQSRYLSKRALNLLGYVGISERYEASLALFNRLYGTKLKVLDVNRSKEEHISVSEIDPAVKKRLEALNREDIDLYKNAVALFEMRQALSEKHLPFTHGGIQEKSAQSVKGLAFQAERDDAVEIDVYVGDRLNGSVRALQLRPGMVNQGAPRRGYIGFEYRFAAPVDPQQIRCVVRETGQEIV